MKLITSVEIAHFRSIRDLQVKGFGDLSSFAGLNNAGKSNVLKALSLFFRGEVEPGLGLTFGRDYYRPEANAKKKKHIRVTVTFQIPKMFGFRAGLAAVKDLVGEEVTITKEWSISSAAPRYLLGGQTPADANESQLIDQFLNLIAFRYIPNRVSPVEVIKREHVALRDAMIRRLGQRKQEASDVFADIRGISVKLVDKISRHFSRTIGEKSALRLQTPSKWADVLFSLGYQVSDGELETEDVLQGSGVQSLLMLETLSLIDRDFFQQFGWRQAAVWAFEEPESSLHTALEARVAGYLSELATDPKGRLQVIATTHSDLILQHSDSGYLLKREGNQTRLVESDLEQVITKSGEIGAARWVDPLLLFPREPLLLVEGEHDVAFIEKAMGLLGAPDLRIVCLKNLHGGKTGGVDDTLTYLKVQAETLKRRVAPLIVVLDWESNKKEGFEKALRVSTKAAVQQWPKDSANPTLGRTFRGIERFMSDRVIREADRRVGVVAANRKGNRSVPGDEYESLKTEVRRVISKGLVADDLLYATAFLSEVLNRVRQLSTQ